MPSSDKQKQYIDRIIAKALEKALKNKGTLLFDPQGRVLIDVLLSEQDIALFKEGFGENRSPSPVTTVSLDIIDLSLNSTEEANCFVDAVLESSYTGVYTPLFHSASPRTSLSSASLERGLMAVSELKQCYQTQFGLKDKQVECLSSIRDSIIPLQQEFHFHLALAARTYTKADKNRFPEDKMTIAHQNAMKEVQKLIQDEFKKALEKATKDGEIDDVALVKELDKARARILQQAHNLLMEEIVKVTGKTLTRDEFKKLDIKHKAEETTATSKDLLHTNQSLKQATWISSSQNTSHKRSVDTLADRQIVIITLDDKPQGRPCLQIRTPSLDVKKDIFEYSLYEKIFGHAKKKEKSNKINDISIKLLSLEFKYSMRDFITKNPVGTKAFTYNLHTAINDRLDDLRAANKQSEGARVILSGAHLYNKAQMGRADGDPVLCLVQNISINGFGDSLGSGNDLRTEATLMAEMAMLYNLVSKDDLSIDKIKTVFKKYKQFLESAPTYPEEDLFFSSSKEGKEAIELIQSIKADWAKREVNVSEADPVEQAKAALKTMMANHLHHQHEYSKLVQSLSVFIEHASISGCKSGNERAQAINGRVAILEHGATNPESELFEAIKILAMAKPENVSDCAAKLKQNLDDKYDKHLQSAVSLISDVDQGASAKVKPKDTSWKFWKRFDRNNAEESSLKHLSQGKAGDMQAHKGLTEQMAEAWPPKKGFWSFLSKKDVFLGIVSLGYWFNKRNREYNEAMSQAQDRISRGMEVFKSASSQPPKTEDGNPVMDEQLDGPKVDTPDKVDIPRMDIEPKSPQIPDWRSTKSSVQVASQIAYVNIHQQTKYKEVVGEERALKTEQQLEILQDLDEEQHVEQSLSRNNNS